MQLLSSGLNLATQQFQEGHLKASTTVKNGKKYENKTEGGTKIYNFVNFISVVSMMNSKYRSTLCECKKLNGTGLLQKTSALITADKILYDHAIQMVSLR